MITLRQLRYLASLARHRHFGRAADECAVTQPALSMQVRELEREIGMQLVERRPGDIALTDTGLEVAQRAERILSATRDLVDYALHRRILPRTRSVRLCPPSRHPRRTLAARHHSDGGAICLAARAAATAKPLSAAAD